VGAGSVAVTPHGWPLLGAMGDSGTAESAVQDAGRTGPWNLTIPRKLARNVPRLARPEILIRRKRKRSGWSAC